MDYYVMAAAGGVLMLAAWVKAMLATYGPSFFNRNNKEGE